MTIKIIPRPDEYDFKLMYWIDTMRWSGFDVTWDNVVPGTPEELAEEKRQGEEWERQRDEALQAWLDGECCGHHDCRNDMTGLCSMALGGCYLHAKGLEAAKEEWKFVDYDHECPMSPWTRFREWKRLQREMERCARNGKTNSEDIREYLNNAIDEGYGDPVQPVDGSIQGPTV